MRRSSTFLVTVIAGLLLASCSSTPAVGVDAGPSDGGVSDAGVIDAGSTDAGNLDAGNIDAGNIDAGPLDAGTTDAGPLDAGPLDAGSLDAGPTDAGPLLGSLTVVISAPATGAPSVLLTGPNLSLPLVATTAVFALPGTYTVTASNLRTPDPTVPRIYAPTITGSPVTVVAGGTYTITVDFEPVLGSGMLWVGGQNGVTTVLAATDVQNLSGSSAAFVPAFDLVAPNSQVSLAGMAFDGNGHIWAGNGDGQDLVAKVYAYSIFPDGGGDVDAILQPDSGWCVTSLAFANNGDLWALDWVMNRLYRWSPGQLDDALDGGQPVPIILNTQWYDDGGGTISNAFQMTFDPSGNLWVANGSSGTITELAIYLDGGVVLTADGGADSQLLATIVDDGSGLLHTPDAISFDPSGKLWVAAYDSDSIFELDPTGISGETALAPLTVFRNLDGGARWLSEVTSFTFDASGNMWLTGGHAIAAEILAPGGYSGLVQPPAEVELQNPSGFGPYAGVSDVVFYPAAPGLVQFP